jgi:hypothetical protein
MHLRAADQVEAEIDWEGMAWPWRLRARSASPKLFGPIYLQLTFAPSSREIDRAMKDKVGEVYAGGMRTDRM